MRPHTYRQAVNQLLGGLRLVQGTQKSPHREEQKTAAEHDDQQAAQVQPSPSAKSIAAAAISAV